MAKRLVQAFQTEPAIVTEMFSTIAVFAEVTTAPAQGCLNPTACNYDPDNDIGNDMTQCIFRQTLALAQKMVMVSKTTR